MYLPFGSLNESLLQQKVPSGSLTWPLIDQNSGSESEKETFDQCLQTFTPGSSLLSRQHSRVFPGVLGISPPVISPPGAKSLGISPPGAKSLEISPPGGQIPRDLALPARPPLGISHPPPSPNDTVQRIFLYLDLTTKKTSEIWFGNLFDNGFAQVRLGANVVWYFQKSELTS